MSINDILEKVKSYYQVFIGLTIATIFFGLGRLSTIDHSKEPINIKYESVANLFSNVSSTESSTSSSKNEAEKATKTVDTVSIPENSNVIGAKTSKKYYFPWCGTVKRIKAENQVYFKTIDEARSAGYVPGGNCKGLK